MQWRIGTLLFVLALASVTAEETLPVGDEQKGTVDTVLKANPDNYEVTLIDNTAGETTAVIKVDQTVESAATTTNNDESELEDSAISVGDQDARTKLLSGGKPAIQLILNPEPTTRYPPHYTYYPPYTYPTAAPTPRPTPSYPYPYPPYPYPYPPTEATTTTAKPYPQYPPAYPYPPNYPSYGYPPYSGYPGYRPPYYGGYPYGGYPYSYSYPYPYPYPHHHHHHHTTTTTKKAQTRREFTEDFPAGDFPPEAFAPGGFVPGEFKSANFKVDSLAEEKTLKAKEPVKTLPFFSFLNIGKFRK